jgi:two-component system, sensor histidine kinase and response regulator
MESRDAVVDTEHKTCIVVIDDDRMTLDRVIATLRVKGYAAEGTTRGAPGVTLVREQKPDLVLCDINMPGQSGYDVLTILRDDPVTAGIPFVFMTARSERDDMRRGMTLGADDYLSKPFTNDELIDTVHAALERRRLATQKLEETINLLRKNIVYALPHELRTPLAGSIGFAEILRMDADVLTPDEIRELADRVIRHNKRLHRVLENYLIYTQVEVFAADPGQLERLRGHITGQTGDIIAAVAHEQATIYQREDDLNVTTQNLALRIAEDDLRKIIAELVDNAFKFSEAGQTVYVCAERGQSHYIVRITDQGRGMTPEQIEQISAFLQFERVLYEQQGLGLGLAIARRLVELHHGQLTLLSKPGVETEVRVSFPLYG